MARKAYTEISAKRAILAFDEQIPIGTWVEWRGNKYRTQSHAGRLPDNDVGVFLDGLEVAVPISQLTIEAPQKPARKAK